MTWQELLERIPQMIHPLSMNDDAIFTDVWGNEYLIDGITSPHDGDKENEIEPNLKYSLTE
jgi:hypothetical protein